MNYLKKLGTAIAAMSILVMHASIFAAAYQPQHTQINVAIKLSAAGWGQNSVLDTVINNQQGLMQKITPKQLRHITLTFAQIPITNQLVQLFPKLLPGKTAQTLTQQDIQNMATSIQTFVQNHIGIWFDQARQNQPALQQLTAPNFLLQFKQLAKFGPKLSAEFWSNNEFDALWKYIRIKFSQAYPQATYTFATVVPHISLGDINPQFNINNLKQPFQLGSPISPFSIHKTASKAALQVRAWAS